jgi:hypothetical protein
MRLRHTIAVASFLLASCFAARADIGLVLDAKPNVGLEFGNELTGAGHAGVYLSHVCAESPVRLRLCQPGEQGSVIQSYEDFKEDAAYEWNVVPLNVYLYGIDEPQQRPLFGSPELRLALQERYRLQHLHSICTTERCIGNPHANWRDSVAAAFVREIYIFQVRTTEDQDESFIREFNVRANASHYNGFFFNCADFAKLVLNTYFPHAAHRNVISDLGLSSPKAIARSFTHYAEHHPELQLQVIRVEQLPGTFKRSSDSHEGIEQLLRAKKWWLPVVAIGYQAFPVLAASYLITGRFNPDHELHEHPTAEAAALQEQAWEAKRAGDKALQRANEAELRAERESEAGSPQQWTNLQRRFDEVVQSAIADGVIGNRRELRTLFRDLQARGHVYLDDDQQPWLTVHSEGKLRRVGLSAGNILGPNSDQRLGFQLLLARTEDLLAAPPKHRELYPELEHDWELLQRAEQAMRMPGAREVIAARQ